MSEQVGTRDIRATQESRMAKQSYSDASWISLAAAGEHMARLASSNYRKLAPFMGKRARTIEVGSDDAISAEKSGVFQKIKEHRNAVFQASVAGVCDAVQMDAGRSTPLEQSLESTSKVSSYRLQERTEFLKRWSISANRNNSAEIVESFPQSRTPLIISKFASAVRDRVCQISEAALITGRLHMQEMVDRCEKLAPFFAPSARTVGAGAGWINMHRGIASAVAVGAATAAAGVAMFSGHAIAAEIQQGISNAFDFLQHTHSMDPAQIHGLTSGAIQHMDPSLDIQSINMTDHISSMGVADPTHTAHAWADAAGGTDGTHDILQAASFTPKAESSHAITLAQNIVEAPASRMTISPDHITGSGLNISPSGAEDQIVHHSTQAAKRAASTTHHIQSNSDHLNEAQIHRTAKHAHLAKGASNTPYFTSPADKLNYEQLQHTFIDASVPSSSITGRSARPVSTPYFTSPADKLNYEQLQRSGALSSTPAPSTNVAPYQQPIPSSNGTSAIGPRGDGWDIGRSVARKMAENSGAAPTLPTGHGIQATSVTSMPLSPVAPAITPEAGIVVPQDGLVSDRPSVVNSQLLNRLEGYYKK